MAHDPKPELDPYAPEPSERQAAPGSESRAYGTSKGSITERLSQGIGGRLVSRVTDRLGGSVGGERQDSDDKNTSSYKHDTDGARSGGLFEGGSRSGARGIRGKIQDRRNTTREAGSGSGRRSERLRTRHGRR